MDAIAVPGLLYSNCDKNIAEGFFTDTSPLDCIEKTPSSPVGPNLFL
jgi:hypothetical protein